MVRSDRPPASSDAVRQRMRATKRVDTPAELALRSALHRRGLRFMVNRTIPGAGKTKPDIVFSKARVAVFVDGCFWHRCPQHCSIPKTNSAWWEEKLDGNVARDRRHDETLRQAGWMVIRVWEHEELEAVAERIQRAVRGPSG